MSHGMAHFMNRFRQNTDLRNCLPEIKDVAKAHANTCKQRREAGAEIQKWARMQDEHLSKFLFDMCQAEERVNEHEALYQETYLEYYHIWKEVLSEQTELIHKESEHSKAKEKLVRAEETLRKEEAKNGDVSTAKAKVIAAETAATTAHEDLKRKMFEVQRDVFAKLRIAYFKMHTARLQMLKAQAVEGASALLAIRAFPTVASLEDGKVIPGQYQAPLTENYEPIWHRGEEFFAELQALRPFRPRYEEAALQVEEYERHKTTCALSSSERDRKHAEDMTAMSKRLVEDLKRKEISVAVEIAARLSILDAQAALTKDVADVLVEHARAAQSSLQALATGVGSPVDFAHKIISCVAAGEVAVQAFSDKTQENFKTITGNVIEKTEAVLKAAEAAPGSVLPPAVVQPLNQDLSALALAAAALQVQADLPPEVAKGVTGAQAAIREALKLVEGHREQSRSKDKEPVLALNQELLSEGLNMLTSAKDIIDSATTMQAELAKADDHVATRRYTAAMATAVDTLLMGVPQWLELVVPVISGKGRIEDFQAVTRSISACSAQLVAFVRTQSGFHQAAGAGSSVIEKATGSLQVASHKVIAAAGGIGTHHLSGMALEDYSKLGGNEINKLLLTCQAESLRLEKALEMEREKLGRLRKLQK